MEGGASGAQPAAAGAVGMYDSDWRCFLVELLDEVAGVDHGLNPGSMLSAFASSPAMLELRRGPPPAVVSAAGAQLCSWVLAVYGLHRSQDPDAEYGADLASTLAQ